MNKYNLLALTAIALSASMAHAVLDVNLNVKMSIGVQTCVGGGTIQCQQSINATDTGKLTIPVKSLNAQAIDLSKGTLDLNLPLVPGMKTAYKLVPSTGDSAGKTVYLVFENAVQAAGSKDYGKLIMKVYRHVEGVDIANQFANLGSISIKQLALTFDAKPDGTLSTQDEKFFLGKTVMNKTEEAAAAA